MPQQVCTPLSFVIMKKLKRLSLILLILLSPAFFIRCDEREQRPTFVARPVSSFTHDLATRYFELQLKLTKESFGVSPPVAARAFAYSSITFYESLVHGMASGNSLGSQLNSPPVLPIPESGADYCWPAVANSAMSTILLKLFPQATEVNKRLVQSLEDEMNTQFREIADDVVLSRSFSFGEAVAEAVYDYSRSDGGHNGYLPDLPFQYVPPQGAGLWVPTFDNGFKPAVKPFWGNNRPLVPGVVERSQPVLMPPSYDEAPTSAFYQEAFEVYQTSSNLSQEQIDIAEYWSDDPVRTSTPPGHSISILTSILKKENKDLAFAAVAYAKMGIAVNEGFISCWKTKYATNYLRPITFIRKKIDPGWAPILITPPFPEYTSGHSVQSGAAAEVLESLFGVTYAFTDMTHAARQDINGAPRSFSSFEDFANEAALSRLYGGIHFRTAIEQGVIQGRRVGKEINNLHWQKQ